MSHRTGTVQTVTPAVTIGPDAGPATSPPDTWALNFAHVPAPTGTKLLMLHFRNASLPANNRLEVDLGYGTDVFTSADGVEFWTRPVNIYVLPGGLVPIRYITNGASTGSVQLDRYGRGESLPGDPGHPSLSNSDPFLKDPTYTEPTYDPFWYCANPPNWENVACITPASDVRARVARSVGMIVSVEGNTAVGEYISTCSVTLVDPDKIISAGHCHTPAQALTSSVTFDYQTECSGARPSGYSARFHKVKAVLEHRYDGTPEGYDYSLLQLATGPPGLPAIQLRHDVPGPGEQVFGVHHPNGAVKKLSVPHPGFDTVLSSSATAVRVHSNFHVSGGSSGSGLFDTAGRIVGVLSNGNPCAGGPALRYFPTASIVTDIAPTPPLPVTRDVMVVFDRSGSMSMDDGTGRTKIEAARDAVSLFVQLVRSGVGNRAGLVSFSTTATSPADFNLAAVTDPNKATLVGPPPYSGGKVGALSPGGLTSIGDGLDKGGLQFPAPGANPRALLLMTDGLQNTPPMISTVDGSLAGITVHAIGFGTEANLDGPLLTGLAAAHGGLYTRAGSGLALEKFFSAAFGNIFEAGIVMDPESDLDADVRVGPAQSFLVCGEDAVTVVIGWDRADASLLIEVTTPAGVSITGGSAGVDDATGRTWAFLRIPLPHGIERDGTWTARVSRPGGGEFPPPAPQLRYFINVIPTGGPQLRRAPDAHRYYTGDVINPLAVLRYSDNTWPGEATMQVTVSRPDAGAGNILSQAKLGPPVTVDGDTLPARQATLTALEGQSSQPLIGYTEHTFELFEDAANTEGSFEEAAAFGRPLSELLTMEGSYTFHHRATYGAGCTGMRELMWSVHIDVGVDPGQTGITVTPGGTGPGGTQAVTVTIAPRDKYGNHVGPGRGDDLTVTGAPDTTVTGPVHDNGDGSYTVPGTWGAGSGRPPGVVVGQPGRPPVIVQDPSARPKPRCAKWKCLCLALSILLLLLLGRRQLHRHRSGSGRRRKKLHRRIRRHGWPHRLPGL